ncbi:RHO1 GDP-GTP exchange protein 2 [Balamuthia mandrillaris]
MTQRIRLNVKVVEGKGLAAKDRGGFSDPYCVLVLLKEDSYQNEVLLHKHHSFYYWNPKRQNVFKTATCYRTLTPRWADEKFKMTMSTNKGRELLVELWDWNRLSNDDFLGEVRVPLDSLPVGEGMLDRWFPLQKRFSSQKVSGTLHLLLSLRSVTVQEEKEVQRQMSLSHVNKLSIAPEVWEMLSPSEQQRQQVICEIINTERSYVRDLDIITQVFVEGIRERALLSLEESASLFSNVQTLLDMHMHLKCDLEGLWEKSDGLIKTGIGDIFLEKVSLFKHYVEYCSNHSSVSQKIKFFRERSNEFDTFLNECEKLPECRKNSLASFLIVPLQRMCKYPLLLKNLLKHTEEDDPDYISLKNASITIETMVENVNLALEQEKRMQRMLQIQRSLVDNRQMSNLVTEERFVVKEGAAKLKNGQGGKSSKVYVLLLNDIFVITKRNDRKDTMKVKAALWLHYCIHSVDHHSSKKASLKRKGSKIGSTSSSSPALLSPPSNNEETEGKEEKKHKKKGSKIEIPPSSSTTTFTSPRKEEERTESTRSVARVSLTVSSDDTLTTKQEHLLTISSTTESSSPSSLLQEPEKGQLLPSNAAKSPRQPHKHEKAERTLRIIYNNTNTNEEDAIRNSNSSSSLYTIVFQSKEEREQWVAALNQAIIQIASSSGAPPRQDLMASMFSTSEPVKTRKRSNSFRKSLRASINLSPSDLPFLKQHSSSSSSIPSSSSPSPAPSSLPVPPQRSNSVLKLPLRLKHPRSSPSSPRKEEEQQHTNDSALPSSEIVPSSTSQSLPSSPRNSSEREERLQRMLEQETRIREEFQQVCKTLQEQLTELQRRNAELEAKLSLLQQSDSSSLPQNNNTTAKEE